MRFFLCFPQFKLCTAHHHFMTELNKFSDQFFQVQYTSAGLLQGHIVDTIAGLQFGVFIQLVDDHIGNGISFQINDNAGAFFIVRFVVDMGNAFNRFFHSPADQSGRKAHRGLPGKELR